MIGTDINPRFLERARLGWYGPWSFRGVDPARRDRWFRPERNGWRVAPELRPSVRFASLNLLDGASPDWRRGVDVIFCRNVAIYFDLETVGQVAARLARSLCEGGWLVPGPSDPLLPAGLGLVATLRGPMVYRRTAAGSPPADAPPRRSGPPAPRIARRRIATPPRRRPRGRRLLARTARRAPPPRGRRELIVTATQQQVTGIGQIAQAMRAIDQATSQTVEGTRQSERAARDLSGLASRLRDAVSHYRT